MVDGALRLGRESRDWSQQEAAARVGVSQAYWSMLENGQRRVNPSLARKVSRLFGLTASFLPVPAQFRVRETEARRLAEDLASLGYPGFTQYRTRRPQHNPAEVLLTALAQRELDPRLTEALPWLVMRYPNMDSEWLVANARVHNLQNRLGFVVALAKQVGERREGPSTERVRTLARLESLLDQSRLVREDTLCQESLNDVERRWLRENRGEEAKHWNLLTGWRPDALRYVT